MIEKEVNNCEKQQLGELNEYLDRLEVLWMEIRLAQLRYRLLLPAQEEDVQPERRVVARNENKSFFSSPFFVTFSLTLLMLFLTTLLVETKEAFHSRQELLDAVDSYLEDSGRETAIAAKHGWPIRTWRVSKVQNFRDVFSRHRNPLAAKFNSDLSGWDMSGATNMEGMFHGAVEFDQDISHWNVSGVVSMDNLFESATKFQGVGLEYWDVSSVQSSRLMFSNAQAFNQDISRLVFNSACRRTTLSLVSKRFA